VSWLTSAEPISGVIASPWARSKSERAPRIPVFNSVNLDRIAEFRQRGLSSTDQMRFVVQRLTAEEIADLIGRARCRSRLAATYSRRHRRRGRNRGISRDVIASLKRHGFIDGAIRAPQPGAPFAHLTTKTFLEAFGFASLRDLPDLERLKAEGLMQTGQGEDDLDSALGVAEEEQDSLEDNNELWC
jgi:putative transcriptional regulator (Ypuh-like)